MTITTPAATLSAITVPTTVAKPRRIPPREAMLLKAMPSWRNTSPRSEYTRALSCEKAPPGPFSAAASSCPWPVTIWMNVWFPNSRYGV